MYKHITRDGEEIPLNQLETSHLENIIALQKRLAVEGVLYRDGGGTCPDDFWYEEEVFYGEEALEFMKHELYLKELARRKDNMV